MNINVVANPRVSIIILNWNGLEDTTECLDSLRKITYPNYNVVIVDNGSSENDSAVLEEKFAGYIKIIRNDKNYGFAEGNNIGMRHALTNSNPDYILLLNNDTVVEPHFLDELVKVVETDAKIGIVGPKIYYYDKPQTIYFAGGKLLRRIGQPFHIGLRQLDNGQFDKYEDVAFITGCALLIRAVIVNKVGLLDPDYFAYCEDLDWCVRIKKAGYRVVFVPQAKIWHKGSSTLGLMSPSYIYLTTRSRILFVKKNASIVDFLFIFIPYFIVIRIIRLLLIFAAKGNPGIAKALFAGISDGLLHNWREPNRYS